MSVWKPTEKIKFIKDDQKYGIKVDWDKVRKEFNALGIPPETYSPLKADISKCGYIIDMSDRSRGKTTNKLILGLLLFKMYGIQLQYIRRSKVEVEKKNLRDLYKTVLAFKYIDKIFGGVYNSIDYYGKRWSLVRVDKNAKVIDRCEVHCTFCIGLDESDTLKSTYNAPFGDFIYHDEFIESVYGYSDFVRFADICKTIIRDRVSPVIFMSSNTIDKNSPWFDELCIRDDLDEMKMGEHRYINSDLGTHIYLELLEPNVSADRQEVNTKYWGFANPSLTSITGRGEWATDSYPHIPTYRYPEKKRFEVLQKNVYIRMGKRLVNLQLVDEEDIGVCVFVHPATKTYEDSIIMTADELTSKLDIFGVGRGTFLDAYWLLFRKNRFYYVRNGEGSFVKSYLQYVRTKESAMLMR